MQLDSSFEFCILKLFFIKGFFQCIIPLLIYSNKHRLFLKKDYNYYSVIKYMLAIYDMQIFYLYDFMLILEKEKLK